MTPLWWAGLAVAVPLAAWWLWPRLRHPLDLVPRFMRTWPLLRRWYWQPEQIAEARRRAREMHKLFEQWTDDALDVVAERDRRRAEHMNRTLRQVEGGDA